MINKESAYRYYGSLEAACNGVNEIQKEGDVVTVLENHQCHNGKHVETVKLMIVPDDTGPILVTRYRVEYEMTSS